MAKWIMVVDDDTSNLQMAGHILSKNNMRVTALKSGRALLDYIDESLFAVVRIFPLVAKFAQSPVVPSYVQERKVNVLHFVHGSL